MGYILLMMTWAFLSISLFNIRERTENKDDRMFAAAVLFIVSSVVMAALSTYAETKCTEVFFLRSILRDHNIGKFVPDSDTYFQINAEQEVIPNATVAPITAESITPSAATRATP